MATQVETVRYQTPNVFDKFVCSSRLTGGICTFISVTVIFLLVHQVIRASGPLPSWLSTAVTRAKMISRSKQKQSATLTVSAFPKGKCPVVF